MTLSFQTNGRPWNTQYRILFTDRRVLSEVKTNCTRDTKRNFRSPKSARDQQCPNDDDTRQLHISNTDILDRNEVVLRQRVSIDVGLLMTRKRKKT